jgi:RNA polymerase sigma-B factor
LKSKNDPVSKYIQTKDPSLKDEVIEKYTPLIKYIARKLAFNRDDLDDLIQVGSIALLRALDRFQPEKETDFATFATPNIIGEIKHYFRDKSRTVKIPRKLQELHSKIKTELKLHQQSAHSPTIKELAEKFDVSQEHIIEALEVSQQSRIQSLDAPMHKGSNSSTANDPSLIDSLGTDPIEDTLLNKETLKTTISQLSDREKRIIYLRFYGGLSQSEIALRMGLSQMHISRLLAKALKSLRKKIEKEH